MDWRAEHSSAIHEIDEQHRSLAECISGIEQAVTREDRWLAVHSAFGRLARLEEHADDHRAFFADLKVSHGSLESFIEAGKSTYFGLRL